MSSRLESKMLSQALSEKVKREVDHWGRKGIVPTLAVLLVAEDPASVQYAQVKARRAKKLGISMQMHTFPNGITEDHLLQFIKQLNDDSDVHGIMIELPLPKQINVEALANVISPLKDVDGIAPANQLAYFTGKPGIYPATPQSCIQILKHYGYALEGKHVVLIGRGETVGKPLMPMLIRENATVTVCHSYTKHLRTHISHADILITAAGRAGLITPDMVHSNLVVIDAGINETSGGIAGDAVPELASFVQAVTPVPGGVGGLTTAILFENFIRCVKLQLNERGVNA